MINEYLFATFILDSREFAINVEKIREAIKLTDKIIQLPSSPQYVEGIINLRGSIIPIINLKKRFKLEETIINPLSRIAITECNNKYFGMLFDNISEVIRVKTNNIDFVDMKTTNDDIIISGILNLENGKRIIQIIEPDSLAKIEDLPSIHKNSDDLNKKTEEELSNERLQNITFLVENQEFGLNINSVQEVIKIPVIQKGVLTAKYIEGITVIREKPITVINLRKFMGIQLADNTQETRLVVLKNEKFNCAIIVDSIKEVITFRKKEILPVPAISCLEIKEAIYGVLDFFNQRNIILLNIDQLFKEEVVERITSNVDVNKTKENYKSTLQNPNSTNKHKENSLLGQIYIAFFLNQLLAVEILSVQEIIKYTNEIIHLPGEVDFFSGILNLRGQIIPIINLRSYYKFEEYNNIYTSKILIINKNNKRIGFIVDEVSEIIKIENENYLEVPKIISDKHEKELEGQVKKVIEIEDKNGEKKTVMIFNVESFIESIFDHKEINIEGIMSTQNSLIENIIE